MRFKVGDLIAFDTVRDYPVDEAFKQEGLKRAVGEVVTVYTRPTKGYGVIVNPEDGEWFVEEKNLSDFQIGDRVRICALSTSDHDTQVFIGKDRVKGTIQDISMFGDLAYLVEPDWLTDEEMESASDSRKISEGANVFMAMLGVLGTWHTAKQLIKLKENEVNEQ